MPYSLNDFTDDTLVKELLKLHSAFYTEDEVQKIIPIHILGFLIAYAGIGIEIDKTKVAILLKSHAAIVLDGTSILLTTPNLCRALDKLVSSIKWDELLLNIMTERSDTAISGFCLKIKNPGSFVGKVNNVSQLLAKTIMTYGLCRELLHCNTLEMTINLQSHTTGPKSINRGIFQSIIGMRISGAGKVNDITIGFDELAKDSTCAPSHTQIPVLHYVPASISYPFLGYPFGVPIFGDQPPSIYHSPFMGIRPM